jgi:hypothetical protein
MNVVPCFVFLMIYMVAHALILRVPGIAIIHSFIAMVYSCPPPYYR